MSDGRRNFVRLLVAGLLLAAAAAVVVVRHRLVAADGSATEKASRDRYAVVKFGEFTIALELDGNLDAIEHHLIKPHPGSGKFGLEIFQAVEEGTAVKAGDPLFIFSDEKHREEKDRLLLELDDERTNLMLAQEDLEMTRAGNMSSIKGAADQLRAAREAYSRYEEEDAVRKKRDLLDAVDAARGKLLQARSDVVQARDVVNDAYMQDADKVPELEKKVEEAKQKVEQAQTDLDNAHSALRIFKQYDHPQKIRSLTEALTKGKMNLQRELVNAAGNVVKAERRILNHKTRIAQQESALAELTRIRGNLTLAAPVDGIVALGNPNRRRWEDPADLKVGSQVREGQAVASIPDLSAFVVNIEIPEELRSRITTGQQAVVRSKAMPDMVIKGTVESIAPMAQNVNTWDKSSPKIYPATISTQVANKRLMPGMTMRVEIVVERVEKALYVPIEAVYNRDGRKYCRIKTLGGLAEHPVVTGRTSSSFVEILSGVDMGDKVLLHQPGSME